MSCPEEIMRKTPAAALRNILAEPGIRIMPCCYDAFSAKLIEQAGLQKILGFDEYFTEEKRWRADKKNGNEDEGRGQG